MYTDISKPQLFRYWRGVGGFNLAASQYKSSLEDPDLSESELANRKLMFGKFFSECGLFDEAQEFLVSAIDYRDKHELDFEGRKLTAQAQIELLVMLNFRRNVEPKQGDAASVVKYAGQCSERLQSMLEELQQQASQDSHVLAEIECMLANTLQISTMNEACVCFQRPPEEAEEELDQIEAKNERARVLLKKWDNPLVAQVDHSASYIYLAKAYFGSEDGMFDTFIQQCIQYGKTAFQGYSAWLGEMCPKAAECCMSIAIYYNWAKDTEKSLAWSRKSASIWEACAGPSHALAMRNASILANNGQG